MADHGPAVGQHIPRPIVTALLHANRHVADATGYRFPLLRVELRVHRVDAVETLDQQQVGPIPHVLNLGLGESRRRRQLPVPEAPAEGVEQRRGVSGQVFVGIQTAAVEVTDGGSAGFVLRQQHNAGAEGARRMRQDRPQKALRIPDPAQALEVGAVAIGQPLARHQPATADEEGQCGHPLPLPRRPGLAASYLVSAHRCAHLAAQTPVGFSIVLGLPNTVSYA